MGLLVKGIWKEQWYETKAHGGAFKRESAQLRHWITADGSPGISGVGGFDAQTDRYHLYVSLACPWAHRTLIFRELKELQPHIGLSIVSPDMLSNGWTFDQKAGSTGDSLYHSDYLYEIYKKNKADYTGRVTVPVLWDKKNACIVSNESSEIIRMFNSAFTKMTGNKIDFYPEHLRQEINEINDVVYKYINNGVYRCGFATTQKAYDKAYEALFAQLEVLENHLMKHKFLVGDVQTEADWRLFTTLIRFDPVYYGHFKCNKKRIVDYPALLNYLKRLYHHPNIKETVNFLHIKRHYYYSHLTINPTQIVPAGPALDYLEN